MRADHVVVLGLTSVALGGCSTVCKGAGCVSDYGAERLSLLHWSPDRESALDAWEDANTRFDGAESDGADWTVRPAGPGTLLIGMPDANRVVRVALHEDIAGIDPDLEITGTGAFGASLAAVDVNADGVRDLLVGAPEANLDAGAVYVFLGSGGGQTGSLTQADADMVIEGTRPSDRFGSQIEPCADLTGDDFPEVLITAPWLETAPGSDEEIPDLAGAVFLFESDGFSSLPNKPVPEDLGKLWYGADVGDNFGRSVSCRADFTGDRQADLAFGAPFSGDGKVYLFQVDGTPGAEHYPDTGRIDVLIDEDEINRIAVLTPGTTDAWFGWSLAAAEFDQISPLELIVGAPGAHGGSGRVEIFRALEAFTQADPVAWRQVLNESGREQPDHLGRFAVARDLDGDDRDDLLVGAPDWYGDGNLYDAGALYIWSGPGVEVTPTFTVGSAQWTIEGTQPFQRVGHFADVIAVDELNTRGLVLPTRVSPPVDDSG